MAGAHRVGGTLKNQTGQWALDRHNHATRASYRANITPGFSLPPFIGPAIVGRDVRVMVDSVGREMLRRAFAIGQGVPTPVVPAGR